MSPFVSAEETADLVWLQPREILIDSIAGFDLDGYYPRHVLDLVTDTRGEVHLFSATGPHRGEGGRSKKIEHYAIRDDGVHSLPGIQAVNAPIRRIESSVGAEGDLCVLWAEEQYFEPSYHPQALYIQCWSGGAWSLAQVVSDDHAYPLCLGRSSLDIEIARRTTHAFWVDWRNERRHPLSWFASFPNVFHRTRDSAAWNKSTRVPKSGHSSFHFDAVATADDRVHLLWAKEYGALFHAVYVDGRWGRPKKVAPRPRDYDGSRAGIYHVNAALHPSGAIFVAWITITFLSKSERADTLQYRSLVEDSWSEGGVLSLKASDAVWAIGDDGTTGIVVQELPEGFDLVVPRTDDSELYYVVTGRDGSRQRLADRAQAGLFDVSVAPNGVIHLVYAQASPDGDVRLYYRRTIGVDQGRERPSN